MKITQRNAGVNVLYCLPRSESCQQQQDCFKIPSTLIQILTVLTIGNEAGGGFAGVQPPKNKHQLKKWSIHLIIDSSQAWLFTYWINFTMAPPTWLIWLSGASWNLIADLAHHVYDYTVHSIPWCCEFVVYLCRPLFCMLFLIVWLVFT